jgi:hypothetical protein
MATDRATLEAQIETLFGDNSAGEITPQRLRDVMSNILASVDLKGEASNSSASGLRWLPIGGVYDLTIETLPIGSSIVLSSQDGNSETKIIGATTINSIDNIDNPITILLKMGEAVLINRITETQILAHLMSQITFWN